MWARLSSAVYLAGARALTEHTAQLAAPPAVEQPAEPAEHLVPAAEEPEATQSSNSSDASASESSSDSSAPTSSSDSKHDSKHDSEKDSKKDSNGEEPAAATHAEPEAEGSPRGNASNPQTQKFTLASGKHAGQVVEATLISQDARKVRIGWDCGCCANFKKEFLRASILELRGTAPAEDRARVRGRGKGAGRRGRGAGRKR